MNPTKPLLLSVLALAAAPAVALADETTCTGSLGAVTVDDLRVPSGGSCSLQGTTIKGQLKVESGAALTASAVGLVGNLQAEGARSVGLSGSTVGGSIQINQGGGADLSSNTVEGDIQLFANRGSLVVSRNRIDGNLQCKTNSPAPTGGGNVVGGNAEDQCSGLAGGDATSAGAPAGPAPTTPPAPAPTGSTSNPGSDDDDDDVRPTRSRVGVRRGAATLLLPVRCDGDDPCSGTAVLRHRTTTLGRVRYSLDDGRSARLRIVLTRAGRAAMRRGGPLRVTLRADDRTSALTLVRS